MNILWLSRHEPTVKQKEDLMRIFGNGITLVKKSVSVRNGREVVEMMKQEDCEEAVVVLPINIIQQIIEHCNVMPLRAVIDRSFREDGAPIFEHVCFERVRLVTVVTERL